MSRNVNSLLSNDLWKRKHCIIKYQIHCRGSLWYGVRTLSIVNYIKVLMYLHDECKHPWLASRYEQKCQQPFNLLMQTHSRVSSIHPPSVHHVCFPLWWTDCCTCSSAVYYYILATDVFAPLHISAASAALGWVYISLYIAMSHIR